MLLLLQNLLLLLLLLVMVAHQVVTRQVEQMLVTFVVVHGRDGCRRVRIDQVTFHLVAQQSRHFFPFRHTINRSGGKVSQTAHTIDSIVQHGSPFLGDNKLFHLLDTQSHKTETRVVTQPAS